MSRHASSSRSAHSTTAAAAIPASVADIHLPDPPKGSVSAIVFSPIITAAQATASDILVSSWDHSVHHYRINSANAASTSSSSSKPAAGHAADKVIKVQTFKHEAPVLDVCFITNNLAASASVDRRIRLLDLDTGKTLIVGKHDDSVVKVRWCSQSRLLVSSSSDRTIAFWDINYDRSTAEAKAPKLLKRLHMPDKVIAMDISPPFQQGTDDNELVYGASHPGKPAPRDSTPRLVVGMAGRHVYVYDLAPLRSAIDREQRGEKVEDRDWQPDQKRESSLKYMTRDLRCMAAGDGYAMSSVEGRIAVEFFDPSSKVQAMKYAFKCHRETVDEAMQLQNDGEDELETPYDIVYPVHGIAFHPRYVLLLAAPPHSYVHTCKRKY